jgi:uncharacterized protein (TIGR02246 family)
MSTDPAADEMAVRDLLVRLFEAWCQGDGEAYGACFTENSDYIAFNGIHLRGRQENARLHSALFRGVLKGSTISAEVSFLEFLAPTAALVHTVGRGRKRSFQTYVVVKLGNEWRIRSFQNTRVQPLSAWLTRKLAARPAH